VGKAQKEFVNVLLRVVMEEGFEKVKEQRETESKKIFGCKVLANSVNFEAGTAATYLIATRSRPEPKVGMNT
jgi:hypothetical protein